jgi:hypothetical protein
MGLLLSHKRKLRIYPDMLTVAGEGDFEHTGGGLRDEIKVFSAASRYRLFRTLHKLEFKTVTFCTLTYPGEYPTDSRIYKAHLKEYRRRFEIWYGKTPAVWRLEFQKRGAPHYHIMYLDAPFIPIRDWCELWHDVIHSNDPAHLINGVDVKLVTGGSESALVASYLAKYVAKVDDRLSDCMRVKIGRWWGKWNIKEEQPIEVECLDYQAGQVVDRLINARKKQAWYPVDNTLCSVLGETMGTNDFRKLAIGFILEVLQAKK